MSLLQQKRIINAQLPGLEWRNGKIYMIYIAYKNIPNKVGSIYSRLMYSSVFNVKIVGRAKKNQFQHIFS
jgi:hypothetical protein